MKKLDFPLKNSIFLHKTQPIRGSASHNLPKGAHTKKWESPYQIDVTDPKYTDPAYTDTDYTSTIPHCHSPDGQCHNTPGSYDCSCVAPEVGDGFMCKQPDNCHGKDYGPNADCIPLSKVFKIPNYVT